MTWAWWLAEIQSVGFGLLTGAFMLIFRNAHRRAKSAAKEIINGHRQPGTTVHIGPAQALRPIAIGARALVAVTAASPTHAEATREAAIPHAGIRAGEIIAHRAWLLDQEDGLLRSFFRHDIAWQPGKPMEGDVETWGVYSVKSEGDLGEISQSVRVVSVSVPRPMDYGLDNDDGPWFEVRAMGIVTGTVAIWGEIVEHDRGYRSQFAAVEWINGDGPGYDALRKRYGCAK